MVCGMVKFTKKSVPIKKVMESTMNAASVPQMDTTMPPSMAPRHNAVDHDAASRALAVARSSSDTRLGKAARSAVMYTPCRTIIKPDSPIIQTMSLESLTSRKHKAKPACSKFETTMSIFLLYRSASSPMNGCSMANPAILTVNSMPRRNSLPVYSRMRKKAQSC